MPKQRALHVLPIFPTHAFHFSSHILHHLLCHHHIDLQLVPVFRLNDVVAHCISHNIMFCFRPQQQVRDGPEEAISISINSMHMKVTFTLLTCAMIPQCIHSKPKAMFPANINVHCCSYLFPHVQAERIKHHQLEILNTLDNQIHINGLHGLVFILSILHIYFLCVDHIYFLCIFSLLFTGSGHF